MSIQNAKALYDRLLADEKFRRELEQTTSYTKRVQILLSAGFSCTPVELNIAKNEMLQFTNNNQELSQTEQEYIIGGNALKSILDSFDNFLFNEMGETLLPRHNSC